MKWKDLKICMIISFPNNPLISTVYMSVRVNIWELHRRYFSLSSQLKGDNPLTGGAAYILVFIFYKHNKYHLLNMLKIKCDINQQYLKIVGPIIEIFESIDHFMIKA